MPRLPRTINLSPIATPDPRHAESLAFYNSARWKRLRALVLAEFPICQMCDVNVATIGHHIVERLHRPDIELCRSNILAVCDECHTRHHKGAKPWGRGLI